MFVERLLNKFNKDAPIFTEDIIELFCDYSRAQVFRFIKKAVLNKELIRFDKGVYFIPRVTFWGGLSTITSDDIVRSRYIRNEESVFGIYGGLKLLNNFSITTQMPAIIEVISNKEATRKREINIKGRKFILRKSRCEINKDNYAAYTVLQIFNDLSRDDELGDSSKRYLLEYINNQDITKEQLFYMSSNFPIKATKGLIRSGIISEIKC